MRIVLDLQGAQSGSRHRGIGRYSLSLAQAMVRLGKGHEFIIVLNGLLDATIEPIRAMFDDLVGQENIRVWTAAGPVASIDPSNRWRRRAAALQREAFLHSLNPDVVYISSLFEGWDDEAVHSIGLLPSNYCTAVTFYDVIPLIQSEVYLAPHRAFEASYRENIAYLRRADLFFAISESSRQEAIDHVGLDPDAVTSIAAAVDPTFQRQSISGSADEELRHRLRLQKPFVMYSGATDERKNHLKLIKAFSLLPTEILETFQLAIVGRLPDHHRQRFSQAVLECGMTDDQVVITGGVSDDDLRQLYNSCELFVFPSWHEGFGLPALEAMACGAATIGSNNTSIPEVIGRSDALFDPFSEYSIRDKMLEVLTNEELRNALRKHGPQQAKKFSWEKTALRVLERLEQKDWLKRRLDHPATSLYDDGFPGSLIAKIAEIASAPRSVEDWISTAKAIAQNHPGPGTRQFFIDVSELARRDGRSGIQRVLRAVLANLLPNRLAGWQIVPVRSIPGSAGYVKALDFLLTFLGMPTVGLEEPLIEPRNGDVFLLGLDLDWNTILQQAYLKSLRSLGVRIYFVLYDLIPVTQRDSYPTGWNVPALQSRWLDVAQQHDGVICISRAVADQFKDWMDSFGETRLRPLPIGFFHLGADMAGSMPSVGLPTDSGDVLTTLASRTTFLTVGTIEPRKGHLQTLRAFELLWERGDDVNLVIVGKKGWDGINWKLNDLVHRICHHPEFGKRLFWLEAISDEYLDRIYEASDCLLATSIAEGFGIPIIEAATHGVDVIARDIPVFREVAGDRAHYFEGPKPESLADAVDRWVAGRGSGTTPSENVAWLTWKQSTDMLLRVFLENNWYLEWRSGTDLRMRTLDPRFGTVVGKREAREIVTSGSRGWLLHGPYASLEAGRYLVIIRGGGSNMSGAFMDTVIESGDQVLGKAPLNAPDSLLTGILASIEIIAPVKCVSLETRVWVEPESDLAVSQVDIIRLDKPVPANHQVIDDQTMNVN